MTGGQRGKTEGREGVSAEDRLRAAGSQSLTEGAGPDQQEVFLRALAKEAAGSDPVVLAVLREGAVKALKAVGCKTATALVDAALGPDRSADAKSPKGPFEELEPARAPRPLGELLDGIAERLRRHVSMTEADVTAVCLWIALSWVFEHLFLVPYLWVFSPVKRCGKSALLDFLSCFVRRPVSASNITAAALYRVVERHKPTLLIDEFDGAQAENPDLRNVLCAGFQRRIMSGVWRTNPETLEVECFDVYGPKAIAGIGQVSETVADRSIKIEMRRKDKAERLQRLRVDRLWDEARESRRGLLRWGLDHGAQLADMDPETPAYLNDRQADCWRPLLALAMLAGGEWPDAAADSMGELCGRSGETGLKVELLRDLKALFEEHGPALRSSRICAELVKMETRPWSEIRQGGNPISPKLLANMLADFGVRPSVMQTPDGRGSSYQSERFADVFARYLPEGEAPEKTGHAARGALQPCILDQANGDGAFSPIRNLAGVSMLQGCGNGSNPRGSKGGQGCKVAGGEGAEGSECSECQDAAEGWEEGETIREATG